MESERVSGERESEWRVRELVERIVKKIKVKKTFFYLCLLLNIYDHKIICNIR